MHPVHFDHWTRSFATSRRRVVGAALAGVAAVGGLRARPVAAEDATPAPAQASPAAGNEGATPVAARTVCSNPDVGDLSQRAVGELLDAEEITDPSDPNFPPGARAWRVLYVSTGHDNTDKVAVCGIVVAPQAAEQIALTGDGGVTARAVTWCHGTLGMTQRCQPSTQPASEIWGATPYGINVLSWGSDAAGDKHVGAPEDGILAGMIAAGWVVTASDYLTALDGSDLLEPFVVGKIEAANTIDNLRAAHQLLQREYPGYAAAAYDVVTWGHSQGGHAALWSGQLLEAYAAATANAGDPALQLSGVALEAAGSNFIVQPERQPEADPASGLLDWMANAQLKLTGVPTPVPGAPFFFSYLAGSWAQHSTFAAPAADQMPAFPAVGELDLTALMLESSLHTVSLVDGICWADGEQLVEYTTPYLTTPFLQPEVANGPVIDGFQHGALGSLCAGTPTPELDRWCAWFRYNLPGPLGVHELPKLPMRGDALVPVLITHGSADVVVHCVAAQDAENDVPGASDCMSVAVYDAMKAEYCPTGGDQGSLQLRIWRPEEGVTAADHSDITALPGTASIDAPAFSGSMLQQFMQAAFDGAVPAGCSAEVVNQG